MTKNGSHTKKEDDRPVHSRYYRVGRNIAGKSNI